MSFTPPNQPPADQPPSMHKPLQPPQQQPMQPMQPPAAASPKVPPVAWLIPLAGLLAVIGVFTPWFKPEVSASINGKAMSESVDNALYSWKDGKIGLLAPILLVVLGIGVIGLMRGKASARFSRGSSGPVVAAARSAMIVGAVSLVAVVVAWFLLPTQYKFTAGGSTYSWDGFQNALKEHGASNVDIGHGPQIGYWLTIAAALIAIVGGALMLVTRDKAAEQQALAAQASFVPPPPAPNTAFAPAPMLNQPAPGQPVQGQPGGYPPAPSQHAQGAPPHA